MRRSPNVKPATTLPEVEEYAALATRVMEMTLFLPTASVVTVLDDQQCYRDDFVRFVVAWSVPTHPGHYEIYIRRTGTEWKAKIKVSLDSMDPWDAMNASKTLQCVAHAVTLAEGIMNGER